MNALNLSTRRRLVAVGLAVMTSALSAHAFAAGGAPTRFTAGVWSSPASGANVARTAGVEKAEFARLEIAPASAMPAGNPLTKGGSPFVFDKR